MLTCLYGEMRDALWPDHGLSGSMARNAFGVTLLPARYGARERRQIASPRASAAALRIAEMLVL
jgi:hypothetical protein